MLTAVCLVVAIAGMVGAKFRLAVKHLVMPQASNLTVRPGPVRACFYPPVTTLIVPLQVGPQPQHEKRRHRTFDVGKPKRGIGRHSESFQPPFRLPLMPVKEFHRYLP
jgi:hypothetical protein